MICGDEPYDEHFPYRSSSLLSDFFDDLWLDYRHGGSTRRFWVEAVLRELGLPPESRKIRELLTAPIEEDLLLTDDLKRVITYIVNPAHFIHRQLHLEAAIAQMNEVLATHNLHMVLEPGAQNSYLITLDNRAKVPLTPEVEVAAPGVLVVRPTVFHVPERRVLEVPQCAILMPFQPLFDEIYQEQIRPAAMDAGYAPLRADDFWKNEVLMDDIFDLLFHSAVVVADLSGRNPNVLYELGVAHMLGKVVVPIVQEKDDVPFDIAHHRYLRYEATTSGRITLYSDLTKRLRQLIA